MSILKDLKNQMLFENLDEEELTIFADNITKMQLSKGDPIFRENEPTLGLYLVKDGEVQITRQMPVDLKTKMLITVRNVQNCCEIIKTPQGWKQVFANLVSGNFFGELSIVEGRKKHGADADAIEDTELYLIKAEVFNEIETANPAVMIKILRTIAKYSSKRLRLLDRQLLKLIIGF
ncbi:transcriptional regulator, Crp/Fnr family [Candidatus Magnetoovum chiemensis]|nr:transcriptional regulator, Crp/Fnr family [Candidatus Magnetoovum chiemensis]